MIVAVARPNWKRKVHFTCTGTGRCALVFLPLMGAPAKQPEFSHVLDIKTSRRTELLDITPEVARLLTESGVTAGVCHLYVPHTTAGLTINENDDPDVPRDIEAALDRLVPRDGPYKHQEGNADAHIKSTLTGVSATVQIEKGRLALGRWQAIFFCEFDGPRQRQVQVRIVPGPGD